MNYVGVDVHKKYSVLCALDERGRKLREARVEGNAPCGFAQFFASLNGPSKAVVEASWEILTECKQWADPMSAEAKRE